MQCGDSQRFATSSVSVRPVLYKVYCVCPNPTVPHGRAIGNDGVWIAHGGGHWAGIPLPPQDSPSPPVLGGQHVRIVSTDSPEWKHELTRYGMSEERVQRLMWEIMRVWDCPGMDDEISPRGT